MGGRGQRSFAPAGGATWTGNLGTNVPKTLKDAIGAKGGPHSVADSIVRTNPYYMPGTAEYSMNCQRCVVAYELRRRGYDVTALPTYEGDILPRVAYHDTRRGTWEGRWKGAFQNAKTVNVGSRGDTPAAEQRVIGNIESKMREYGPGARGVVQIFYRSGGGHVFNVENQGGRIIYSEAQLGEVKNISRTMRDVSTSSVNIVRTDNLRISERARNFVTRN